MDRKKVTHAAQNGIPLVIETHTLPPETEQELEDVLGFFLEELGQTELKDHLAYCLKELTGNAKKANTKRVYFEERGLDLFNDDDYTRGMKTFKEDTLNDIGRYLTLQKEKDLSIRVGFLIRNHGLYLSIRNSAAITPRELTRIFDRVARSRAFESMAEAFDEVMDDSEGAGLGVVILVLMLRKMGLTEKAFDVNLVGQETVATLTIPMEAVKLENVGRITDELVDAIEDLPPFPENLSQMIRLLDDPGVRIEALAAQLARDPAMTADLIRHLNSAGVGRRKPLGSLQEAVQIIGIQGLKDLTYSFGAHRLLDKYLARQKHLGEAATRISRYAHDLVRHTGGDRRVASQAQLAGILSNLGQIIVSFLHPDQSERILEFCRTRAFSVEFFDQLTQAVNPSEVAGRIAEKWNFPEDLVQILRCLGQPAQAPAPLQPVVCAVHLASSLVAVEHDLLTYPQIHSGVLRALKLAKPGEIEAVHRTLKENS